MKFLKKFGQIALKGLGVISGMEIGSGPIASSSALARLEDGIAKLRTVIQQVEIMGQALSLPGAQKLTAATPMVADVILKSAAFANHKIEDPDLFKAGCQKIADGMADVLNSIDSETALPGADTVHYNG